MGNNSILCTTDEYKCFLYPFTIAPWEDGVVGAVTPSYLFIFSQCNWTQSHQKIIKVIKYLWTANGRGITVYTPLQFWCPLSFSTKLKRIKMYYRAFQIAKWLSYIYEAGNIITISILQMKKPIWKNSVNSFSHANSISNRDKLQTHAVWLHRPYSRQTMSLWPSQLLYHVP